MKKLLSFLYLRPNLAVNLPIAGMLLFVTFVMGYFWCTFSSCGNHKKEETKTDHLAVSGNCTYSKDEKDKNGKRVRVVNVEKFIALQFPDSALQALYRGEDFIKGYLGCVSVDTVLGININFTIHTEDAYQYYGVIKKGNKITFVLKSGKTVELQFGNTFSGNTNLSNESTEYSSYAYLSKSAAQQLKSEELQRVIVSWSKKDEDYLVVNPTLFINQLPCVE